MILDREVIAVKSPQFIPPRAASVMWLGMDAMLTFPKVLFTHDKTQGPADGLVIIYRQVILPGLVHEWRRDGPVTRSAIGLATESLSLG